MVVKNVYAPILKSYRDDNGDLVVQGIATSPDLDLDEQVCDPDWLKEAMPAWFEWGNLRSQHSDIPAGHATDMEQLPGDKWWIKGLITNSEAAHMAEKGTYKGFSIAIRDPRVVKDAKAQQLKAAGGRIVGGNIIHVGLVDRPCNPVATLELAKSAKPGMTLKVGDLDQDRMLVKVCDIVEHPENADEPAESIEAQALIKAFSLTPQQVDELPDHVRPLMVNLAAKGATPPSKAVTRYPGSVEQLAELTKTLTPATRDRGATVAHIVAEAQRLDRAELLPAALLKAAQHDAADIASIRDGLVACINAELQELCDGEPELCDIEQLLCSLRMLMSWWEHEALGGETTSPYSEDDDMDEVALWLAAQPQKEKAMGDTKTEDTTKTVEPDTGKAAETSDAPVVPEKLTELVKAAVAEATKDSDERVKALEAELAKVKATPVPGGPVIARTSEGNQAAAHTEQVVRFTQLAKSVHDPDLRAFYNSELKKLAQNGA